MRTLCSLEGWQTVVVGDTKSPASWSQGRCVFLSVAEQQRLGYSIVPLTPTASYTRKNIGYLFAIAHGAEVIFDTDDDNRPRGNHVHELLDKDHAELMSWFRNGSDRLPLGNVYAHFGWPHIWPRGYPLQPPIDLEHPVPTSSSPIAAMMGGQKDGKRSELYIVQGLADLDPDVDAVFRLTHPSETGTIRFCANVPPLRLEAGLYSPFNSQNTLFHQGTLWAMLLPTTTTFRVCDIWRAYWAQRLLWGVGGNVVFQGSTVDQVRNPHSLLDDRQDEKALYEDAERFVVLLDTWAPKTATLPERMVELAEYMVQARLIGEADVALVRAWVSDLTAAGYTFPAVVVAEQQLLAPLPASSLELPRLVQDRMSACRLRQRWSPTLHPIYKDVLLVVNFNHISNYNVMTTFIDLYAPAFPNIMLTGQYVPRSPAPYDIVHYELPRNSSRDGWEQHLGLDIAHDRYGTYNGYLFTNDDVYMDYWYLAKANQSKVWANENPLGNCYDVGSWGVEPGWHWRRSEYASHQQIDIFHKWVAEQKASGYEFAIDPTVERHCSGAAVNLDAYVPNKSFVMWAGYGSDFIYVPHERALPSAKQFFSYLDLFVQHFPNSIFEIIFPTLVYTTIRPQDTHMMKVVYDRNARRAYYNPSAANVLLSSTRTGNPTRVYHSLKVGIPSHDFIGTTIKLLEHSFETFNKTLPPT